MATRVVVTLQDDVYRRVERLAQLTSRDIADLLGRPLPSSSPRLMSLLSRCRLSRLCRTRKS